MPRKSEVKTTVRANYSFFWNTDLSNDRMEEIDAWIGSLTPEKRSLLKDLLQDTTNDVRFDAQESRDYDGRD